VVISVVAFQPTIPSFAQETPSQPFSGKDQWKNRYVKRAEEIRALKGEASTRQRRHADLDIKEDTRQLFVEDIAPSRRQPRRNVAEEVC